MVIKKLGFKVLYWTNWKLSAVRHLLERVNAANSYVLSGAVLLFTSYPTTAGGVG